MVDENLGDDKVVGRTRVLRTTLDRIGSRQKRDEEDTEIEEEVFDDTDFYHQILRDVVDSRKEGNGE